MTTKIERRKKHTSYSDEVVAIMLIAIALLILLSLISYNETDPSIITSSNEPVRNLVGVVGSNLSAILLSALGWAAYALPLLFITISFQIFRSKSAFFDTSKITGFFLFILSSSGLVSIFGGYGAIAGSITSKILSYLIGKVGAIILLSFTLIISVLLITSFSLSHFIDGIKISLRVILEKAQAILRNYQDWRRERRQRAIERRNLRLQSEEIKPKILIEQANGVEPAIIRNSDEPQRNNHESLNIGQNQQEVSINNDQSDEFIEEFIEEIEPQAEMISSPPKNAAHSGEPEVRQNFENYQFPPLDFLTSPPPHLEQRDEELLAIAEQIMSKTKEFNVTGRVVNICQGPVVTTYEFKPDPGVKYSKIVSLADDLCLALKADSIRIDRIPGKAYVGIEVPNARRETIFLREIIESRKFRDSDSLLTIALGKTIDGSNYVTDLAKMPHLLIAGATGSGKSVGVNALIVSILYKAKPNEVKFIMVDPKRLELGLYADIPHLATPIITDPKRAAISLKWAVSEMERRYKYLAGWGVRNIDGYNSEIEKRNAEGKLDEDGKPYKRMPYIVIIIDELADLMMVAGKEVEESITRLAQMARAVGIHLVLATQRPSVDVITGLIKANFPSRISFRVSSKVDSRTIIDTNGAERLLGKGDMLFLPPGSSQIIRIHGAFVDEKEIFKIVEYIKAQGKPEYDETITKTVDEMEKDENFLEDTDPLFWEALRVIVNAKRASTSLLQRHLRIGYGRAAAILDAMVRAGYVGEMDNALRARPVLQAAFEALADFEQKQEQI